MFPLIERLSESGADLGEFMNGAAEMLRSLLMLQLGTEPDGLTEAMRQQLESHRASLAPGDVLRMLKVMADQEQGIRRSANPRLQVETLLLRWTLMDQVVDLEQVLASMAGTPRGAAPRNESRPPAAPVRPESPRVMRESAPPPPTAPAARVPPPEAPEATLASSESPIDPVPFTVAGLETSWAAVVADARKESPFLGEALGASRPIEASAPNVTLELLDPNPVIAERLNRQREVVQGILSRYVGAPVQVALGTASANPGENAPARPKRMSDAGARAERLKTLRKKDPALDAAADELDLEIVD